MTNARRRLTLLLAGGSLALAAPACGTDDAAERDAKDVQEEIDREAGQTDEKAKDAAEDAAREAEKGIEDVDGQ